MLQTTVICGFGMLVFAFSDFSPVSHFSITMCLLLTTAAVGDLIVLPAILLGPLGRFFEEKPRRLSIWQRGFDRQKIHSVEHSET